MLGKTNACVGGSGGGSGETIEVLNKTGAVINQGDKVWLSENVQEAGFLCNVGDSLSSSNFGRAGVLSRSGNFMVLNNKTYSIGTGADGYTQIGNFEAIVYSIIYAPNQAIFARGIYGGSTKRTYRVDEGNQYMVDNEWYVGEDYFVHRNTGTLWGYKYNLDSGVFISSFEIEDGLFTYADANNIIVKNDEIYVLYNTSSTTSSWYKFVYEESSWVKKTISVSNRQGYNGFPLGFTADGKYIVCCLGFTSSSTGNLRLIEVIDDTHMKVLTQAEMPADLQTYYSANCMCAFNPYTGVLTACVNGSTDFVIMKYENGEWTKVSINYTSSNNFYSGITVSDDLSRLSTLNSSSSFSAFQRVYNLTSTEGYVAIPYKPYTVNENTITATALAESQPNEPTQVQIGSVTNETLTVTENGTYTPSATYTGFGSVNVNVKGAEKIEAVNKTGSSITKGDKVWVNENYQGEGNGYELYYVSSGGGDLGGCIDRTGTFGVANWKGYNIGETQGTFTYDVSGGNPLTLFYGDDNSILTCASNYHYLYRIDGKAQFILNPSSIGSFCSKYLFNTYNSPVLRELNMTTGEYVKEWTLSTISTNGAASVVVVNNTVYTFPSTITGHKPYYADLPEESGDLALENKASIENYTRSYTLPLGITSDNKYIVMANGTIGGTSLSGVTFFEVLNKGQLKELSAGELPTDLQPYYSKTCYITFNPYTGILTACVSSGGDYVIIKYENGEWNKIAVENNFSSNFGGPITVSDDLSRVCYKTNYPYQIIIYNLPTTQGYGAIAYNTRNITENTITGYAMADAEPNETVTVSVPVEV